MILNYKSKKIRLANYKPRTTKQTWRSTLLDKMMYGINYLCQFVYIWKM